MGQVHAQYSCRLFKDEYMHGCTKVKRNWRRKNSAYNIGLVHTPRESESIFPEDLGHGASGRRYFGG